MFIVSEQAPGLDTSFYTDVLATRAMIRGIREGERCLNSELMSPPLSVTIHN